ncbi:MAG: hypothetical protein HYV63_05115 [Candidatus Schekmanbacteria bacterium]|nr:hypothetical protein [Candidatus Schekmanbacteria bacterium]
MTHPNRSLTLLSLTMVLGTLILCPAHSVRADYVPQERGGTTNWLVSELEGLLESGARTATEELLTWLGKAVVEYFSPQIADLLFGGSGDSAEMNTQRIIDEVRRLHADLASRADDSLDEVMTQYKSEVMATFNGGLDNLSNWQAFRDPIDRMDTTDTLLFTAEQQFSETRLLLESYLSDPSPDPRIQFRRLQLLQTHATATRLELTTEQLYRGMVAIRSAFRSAYGRYAGRAEYDTWTASLSSEQIEEIERSSWSDDALPRKITAVLDFYASLAERDDLRAYVEDIFTPPVAHMMVFTGNRELFDRSSETNDEGSWGLGGEVYARLDGARWYYYVDVPSADCLDGTPYRTLRSDGRSFWAEDPAAPSASACNRFWIVDPSVSNSADPAYYRYRASMDGYEMWYGASPYDLHKDLVHGDLVREIYGPVALLLDALHAEHFTGSRPLNLWDEVLNEYDVQVGLLAAGQSYDEAVAVDAALRSRCGASPSSVGVAMWSAMLAQTVANGGTPVMCQDALEPDNSWGDAAELHPGMQRRLSLNVPDDVDILRFELLRNHSVLITVEPDEAAFALPPVVELWTQSAGQAEPELVAAASDHPDFGLAIALHAAADETYRHEMLRAFVRIRSEGDETGAYAVAIQTRGPVLPEDGGSFTPVVGSSSGLMEWPKKPGEDGAIEVEESPDAYRLEPSPTGETGVEEITVRGVIHTGGEWIVEHSVLGQTAGADQDPYVIWVPAGHRLSLTIAPVTPDAGQPHGRLTDPWLQARATDDASGWPETGHTLSVTPNLGCSTDGRDVLLRVDGLFDGNYRRDTGSYRLTARLERVSDFYLGSFSGLCTVRDAVAGHLAPLAGRWRPYAPLEEIRVELTVAKMPARPGDPYVLYATTKINGKAVDVFKVEALSTKSTLPFSSLLVLFNTAEMGPLSGLLDSQALPSGK